jgi:hypothetical protein
MSIDRDIEASADNRVGPEFTQIKEAAGGCVISDTNLQCDFKLINNHDGFRIFLLNLEAMKFDQVTKKKKKKKKRKKACRAKFWRSDISASC